MHILQGKKQRNKINQVKFNKNQSIASGKKTSAKSEVFMLLHFVSFQDDIGVGTVVGSAVYNVMFVVGICALFAGKVG